MGRRERTLLPTSANLLNTKVPRMVKKQITNNRRKQASFYNRGSKSLPELKPGDVVRMRPEPNSPNKTWRKGVCKNKVAPRSYEVMPEGKLYRRNRRHLAATTERGEETIPLPDGAPESHSLKYTTTPPPPPR